MNILFINNLPFNPTLGGIERVTDILAKALIKKGYNIHYLCGYIKDNKTLDYNFPTKMNTLPEENLFFSDINRKYFTDYIHDNKIDIIINQKGLDSYLNKSLEISNIKKITVIHSKPKAYLQLYCKVTINKPQSFKDLFKIFIKIIAYPILYIRNKQLGEKYLNKQYNEIVEKSDAIVLLSSRYIKEFLSCKIKNIKIPIIGIANPNAYTNVTLNFEKKEKIILYVGRLNTFAKKPQRILKIWERIYKNNPEWQVVFVGDGTALPELKSYVRLHQIPRVNFAGHQSNVKQYYKIASFICLCSDFEGWGMSLTEGMSYGCIPFTFNNFAAASEIIDDDQNGCLISPFNIKEYAKRIEALMNDENRRKEMSENAFNKVKNFDIENIVIQWEYLFNKITNNSQAK